jgi:hypothetical protein
MADNPTGEIGANIPRPKVWVIGDSTPSNIAYVPSNSCQPAPTRRPLDPSRR